MISNFVEAAEAEKQFTMGYEAALKAHVKRKPLNWVPYPDLCPAAGGWAKATYDLYQERQAKQVKWFSSEQV